MPGKPPPRRRSLCCPFVPALPRQLPKRTGVGPARWSSARGRPDGEYRATGPDPGLLPGASRRRAGLSPLSSGLFCFVLFLFLTRMRKSLPVLKREKDETSPPRNFSASQRSGKHPERRWKPLPPAHGSAPAAGGLRLCGGSGPVPRWNTAPHGPAASSGSRAHRSPRGGGSPERPGANLAGGSAGGRGCPIPSSCSGEQPAQPCML